MPRSTPLGRLLLDTGVISQAALEETLAAQKADPRHLAELVVDRGLVQSRQLAQLLSLQLSCPLVSLSDIDVPADVIGLLPRDVALEHQVVPVHVTVSNGRRRLYVATDDPTDEIGLAQCAAASGIAVRPMVAEGDDLRRAVARYYKSTVRPRAETVPSQGEIAPLGATTYEPASRPPPPPPQRARKKSIREALLEDDIVEVEEVKGRESRDAKVLVLSAPEALRAACSHAATALGVTIVSGALARVAELVAEHHPRAIIVSDDVFAFDRSGLGRLALDEDAQLVVWTDERDGRQLEALLRTAVDRTDGSAREMGSVIDGRYELVRDLGDVERGAGSRWEARDLRTGRRAVLALGAAPDGTDDGAGPVRRERAALARVTHAGAVELRDAGVTELGEPYVVLELLAGRTLDGLVAARTRLHADEACAVLLQIAEVLAAAHAAGAVHRHVVPENIVVSRDAYGVEHVKLTGWGRASFGDASAAAASDDLAALGLCAFEALTGKSPRAGQDVASAGIPAALASVVARALASGGKTFSSANELAQAIQEAAPRATEPTRLLEARRRGRGATAGRVPVPGPEQRRFARAPYRTPVRIEVPGVGAVDARSEEISGSGLLVMSRGEAMKSGTAVTVRFALPLDGRVVAEPAVVKWSRAARSDASSGSCATGVEIQAASPEAARQIELYVAMMRLVGDPRTPR